MNDTDLGIMLPAFTAGLLVLATHVPLGMKVLERGIIFVDLAIAQIASLGVIVAGLLGLEGNIYIVQGMAAGAAMLGAALLSWTEHKRPQVQEASIGIMFVLAASLGVLLMSRDTHAGEHMKDVLVGQILWVSTAQLVTTAAITAALIALWSFFKNRLNHFGFYALFALAVTASVQLVGVYLVFTSLIVPALATHKLRRHRMQVAYGVGVAGYALGLLLSVVFDLPTGAAIVWGIALAGSLVWVGKRL